MTLAGRIVASFILVLAALCASAWLYFSARYEAFLETPLNSGQEDHIFIVERGENLHTVVRRLATDGLTEFDWKWRWLARRNPVSIHVGEYALEPSARPLDLLDMLGSGRVVQHRFTILEGWTWRQLLQALAHDEVLERTLETDIQPEQVSRVGELDETFDYSSLEGLFLPETYYFVRGENDLEILKRAYTAMQSLLRVAWQNRAIGTPLNSPYELLILASIVEKETALEIERDRIAGVFVRRLNKGMRLQTDPTVIYGLGPAFDGDIRKRDLTSDTPYNTYTRHGLPPTPIALPGKASILAAAQPAEGKALYFVANGQGGHTFSETLEEHEKAVRTLGDTN